jgi:hypothetical protein
MPPHLKRGMMEEMEEPEVIRLLEFTGMREALPAPAPAGAESTDEDDDDSQIRFLSRIPSPGQPTARPQGPGQGQGQPQRQGPRQGPPHGQPHGQPHGKKWKQKHKRHGQPGQGQPMVQQPAGEPRQPGQEVTVPQGQAGPMPGNGKPGGHRKRHRGRRGKGRFGQGQNAGGAAPQGEQAAGGDEQPLTNENRRPW